MPDLRTLTQFLYTATSADGLADSVRDNSLYSLSLHLQAMSAMIVKLRWAAWSVVAEISSQRELL